MIDIPLGLDVCDECHHIEAAHVEAGSEHRYEGIEVWGAHCAPGCRCTAFVPSTVPSLEALGPLGRLVLDALAAMDQRPLCCSLPCEFDIRRIAHAINQRAIAAGIGST